MNRLHVFDIGLCFGIYEANALREPVRFAAPVFRARATAETFICWLERNRATNVYDMPEEFEIQVAADMEAFLLPHLDGLMGSVLTPLELLAAFDCSAAGKRLLCAGSVR